MSPPGTVQFGRIPYAPMDAGGLARLSKAEALCLLVIAAHMGEDWTARPGTERIAAKTGLHLRTVQRAVGKLEAKGILDVLPGGGRGRANTYKWRTNPGPPAAVSKGETPAGAANYPGEPSRIPAAEHTNPGCPIPETPAKNSANPGGAAGGTDGTEERREREQGDAPESARKAGPALPQDMKTLKERLRAAGFAGSPAELTRLIQDHPAQVREALGQVDKLPPAERKAAFPGILQDALGGGSGAEPATQGPIIPTELACI